MAMSEEHRKKISEARKKSWTPERREAMRQMRLGAANPFFGKKHSEKFKLELSKAETGRGNPFFGKKHSEAARQLLREGKRGRAPRLAKYGITDDEYAKQIAAGNLWCSSHKSFSPAIDFPPRRNGRCTACSRKAMLKEFGVTPEWYVATLVEQGGGCALCGATPTAKRHLCIDHNHKTGEVRGILCVRCNSAMERLDAAPGWALKAIAYLCKHHATHPHQISSRL